MISGDNDFCYKCAYGIMEEQNKELVEKAKFLETYENKSDQANFKMLDKGRLDALVGYAATIDYWLRGQNKTDAYIKHPSFDFNKEYLTSLLSNGEAKVKVLHFDRGKKIIKDSGVYQKIKNKWGIK